MIEPPFISWVKSIGYHLKNRFGDRNHMLRTGIEPGEYHDLDDRIQRALACALIDYVEVECASLAEPKPHHTFTRLNGWNLLESTRCAEAGLEYLNWETSLTNDAGVPSKQAAAAKEIKELYLWFKNRINEPDADHKRETELLCRIIKVRGSLWT